MPCDLCGRLFGEVAAVRKHVRVVHDKVKDFECYICRRRFAEKSNLKKHMSTNALIDVTTAGRCTTLLMGCADTSTTAILASVSCDLCDSTFKQRTHLQKHQQSVHSVPLEGAQMGAINAFSHSLPVPPTAYVVVLVLVVKAMIYHNLNV